jgi:thioesterase domain-containing protein/acyl carrier protein
MQREPGFGEHDTLLAVTTPTFDISVLEMFLPLVSGGTVVIAGSEETIDPEKLSVAIDRSRCTVMQATPATWQNLFATGWRGVPGLRILCGGEALPGDLARRMLDAGMAVWNVYGPTETTIWSSVQKIERADDITIGRPIDNTTMLVLDPDGRPQPFNVAGELHIGGAGLARGYRDSELTARAFAEVLGHGRLYRTGDIARQRRDGRFEWLGRRDGQVKVRGLRIDLGDIEAALAAHPDVAMAAVRTFDDDSGQKSLAAYTVATQSTPLSATELRDFVRRRLPPYMIPARYIALDAMPLSANGKVDRKALPEPDAGGNAPPPSEPPCGDFEERLAALWMDVLGIDAVNAHDDFQELGGHSLLAARLMAQIERTFGRKLPLSTLLHAPTLRGMAAHLEGTTPPPVRVEVVRLSEGDGAPLFWIDAVPNFRPIRYRPFAAAFGRPLLGLPVDVERHDSLRATASLAELATDLAATVRRHAAEPYLIGGWCNGSILAYEVAAQLIAGGAEVGLLVVLDAPNPVAFRKRRTRMAAQLRQLWTLPRGQRGAFAAETIEGYLSRLHRRFQRTRDDDADLVDLNDRFMRLVNAPRPAPLDAPVLLLQPRDGKLDYAPGWRPVLGDALEAVDVDGGHASVLDPPHAAALAAAIERRCTAVAAEAPLAAE